MENSTKQKKQMMVQGPRGGEIWSLGIMLEGVEICLTLGQRLQI